MIGKTLGLYIARRFFKTTLGMLLSLYFLIVTVDFVEQLRRAADINASILDLYCISLTKAPLFLEQAFPFGCLFATMVTLTQLNSKMELVVARAAGISAWQFLLPIGITAALLGVGVATLYNPVSIYLNEISINITSKVFDGKSIPNVGKVEGYWISSDTNNGKDIINASLARRGGELLNDVKVLQFDSKNAIQRRIDASNAIYRGNNWLLVNAHITQNDGRIVHKETMSIPTSLSKSSLLGFTADPQTISSWNLPGMAKIVSESGGNPGPYLVQFQRLVALPAFLLAMVLVAACFSLKFVRFGQVGRMILGGISCGFVLYTASSLVSALGSNEVVPPFVAAWSPAIVAILFGMSALLYQEDG